MSLKCTHRSGDQTDDDGETIAVSTMSTSTAMMKLMDNGSGDDEVDRQLMAVNCT